MCSSDLGEPELPAVSIALAKKRGTNAVEVTQRIEEKLHELEGDFIPEIGRASCRERV